MKLYRFKEETRCPSPVLYPQSHMAQTKVTLREVAIARDRKLLSPTDTYTRLSRCCTMPRPLKTGMWGHLKKENTCNSLGSLCRQSCTKLMHVFVLIISPIKHQGLSDTASEDIPMREAGAVSIYILERMVRIHGREHSDLRRIRRFSTIRHIFCMLSLGTVFLLFH